MKLKQRNKVEAFVKAMYPELTVVTIDFDHEEDKATFNFKDSRNPLVMYEKGKYFTLEQAKSKV